MAEGKPGSNHDQQATLDQLTEQARQLLNESRSLLLSTVNQGLEPEASYAPFVQGAQGEFFILVSELASHTANLLTQRRCALLIIRDESQSRNIFARERLSFRCQVTPVDKASPQYSTIIDRLTDRFGETVQLLAGLGDFHLLRLSPTSGRYVVGFGQAFDVDPGSGQLTHIDPSDGNQNREAGQAG